MHNYLQLAQGKPSGNGNGVEGDYDDEMSEFMDALPNLDDTRPRSSSHSSRLRCRPAGRSRRSRRRNSSCCEHYAFASIPPLCYAIDLYYVILLL